MNSLLSRPVWHVESFDMACCYFLLLFSWFTASYCLLLGSCGSYMDLATLWLWRQGMSSSCPSWIVGRLLICAIWDENLTEESWSYWVIEGQFPPLNDWLLLDLLRVLELILRQQFNYVVTCRVSNQVFLGDGLCSGVTWCRSTFLTSSAFYLSLISRSVPNTTTLMCLGRAVRSSKGSLWKFKLLFVSYRAYRLPTTPYWILFSSGRAGLQNILHKCHHSCCTIFFQWVLTFYYGNHINLTC